MTGQFPRPRLEPAPSTAPLPDVCREAMTGAQWDGIPTLREAAFLAGSVVGIGLIVPFAAQLAHAAVVVLAFLLSELRLRRRYRVVAVLALMAAYIYVERTLPRPEATYILWSGRALRAFLVLRCIDYVLAKPRKHLSAVRRHRVLQYALYVTYLPAVFSGPVVTFNEFYRSYYPGSAFHRRPLPYNCAKVVWGGLKFYMLAPFLARGEGFLYGLSVGTGPDIGLQAPGLFMWLHILAALLHLYVMFSGFTDMAIGVSRLLGFQLYENFNYPLLASTPLHYWKTWHVSAYHWLMTHVFYPTWNHRQVTLKILTAFMASALWHFSVSTRPGWDAAVHLTCSAILFGGAVAIIARFSPGGFSATLPVKGHGGKLWQRIAANAGTIVFIALIHQIFRAGLAGKPIGETLEMLHTLFIELFTVSIG
jgi:hypothetical protein